MKKPLKISLIVVGIIIGLIVLAFLFGQIVYKVSAHRGKGLVDLKVNGFDGPKVSIVKGQAPILSWHIDGSILGENTCYIFTTGYDEQGGRKTGRAWIDHPKGESDFRNLFIQRFDTLENGSFWLNCRQKMNGVIAAFKSYGDLVKFKTIN